MLSSSHTIIRRRETPSDFDWPDCSLPRSLQRLLAARGVRTVHELDYSLRNLPAFQELLGMDCAVDLLAQAIISDQRLLVIADFDADGATGCAVAVRGLRLLGARAVEYLVPDRFKHGYGLTPALAELAAARAPDVLITVDNGIASVAGVATAKQLGMRVVITDHHLAGEQLPSADAIVNPNQPGDPFPFKHMAGVGVMFYVLSALRARLRDAGWFRARVVSEPNLAQLLDLVALGTVADVVKLDYLNRMLVEQGLRRIRQGQCCAGIQALLQISGRHQATLAANDLGFYLGPRINAAGRMENMSYGIECLLTDNFDTALQMAANLDVINQERRGVEEMMREEADHALAAMHLEQQDGAFPLGLCLYDENWHEGVIGLLASKVKETYHRPVAVLTVAQENPTHLKGSCRSVPAIHIRDVLADIDAHAPGLLLRFGGHAMAAGLTLHRAGLARFQQAFDETVRRHFNGTTPQGIIDSDGELPLSDFTVEYAQFLRLATPWGQGFPEPVFDGIFIVKDHKLLKEKHVKLHIHPENSSTNLVAIVFNAPEIAAWARPGQRARLAYRLDINRFRGDESLQLVVQHVEPVENHTTA